MAKKINPKIVSIALMILAVLATSGLAAKEALGGGVVPSTEPDF
ncbi:MAG: hypothetical protein U9O98_07595 [Asgard group archaeon]|nr:hypothetical protein [Asgard group archaeon]